MASLRPSTSVLPRVLSSRIASLATTRTFSTTTCLSNRIPPESPSYINIPTPPQTEATDKRNPHVKGHLPVPRQIFERRHGERKLDPDFVSQTAPLPTSAESQLPPTSEGQAWKRKMAAARRENLDEGIKGLWARKRRHDGLVKTRQSQRARATRVARRSAAREDDRLTRSTIPDHTLDLTVRPDPLRYERALASRERTSSLNAQKRQDRLDNLQSLYMHARSFITTEKDLETRVEKVFSPDYWKAQGHGMSSENNAWDTWGSPMTLGRMVSETATRDPVKSLEKQAADDRQEANLARTLKRQLRLAEELTGGKMDER